MIPVLINNPLFRGITPEKLSANLEEISFHTRSYKKGEILARQGDVCNRLVILTKGSVRGEMIDYSGRLIKVEDIAAPRAIAPLFLFGEENRYPVEVTANEPTEVIEIPKTSVLELFRKNEQFLENYMTFLPTTHGLYPTSSFSCLSRLSGRRLLLIYFAYISSNNSYISPSTRIATGIK